MSGMRLMSKCWTSVIICGLFLAGVPLLAHHSIASEYDFDKPVTLKGTVTRIDWVNPHSMFHLEVTNDDGSKTMWLFQTGGAGSLRRQKQFLGKQLVGATFSISGFAAKNGKAQGFIKSMVMPDGGQVTMWFGDPNG